MKTKYPYFKHSDLSLHVTPFGGLVFDTSKIREKMAKLYTMPHYVDSTIESILNSAEIVDMDSVSNIHDIITQKVAILNQRLVPLMRVNIMRSSEVMSVIELIDDIPITSVKLNIKQMRECPTVDHNEIFTLNYLDITNVLREYERIGFVLEDNLKEELSSSLVEILTPMIEHLSLADTQSDEMFNPLFDRMRRIIIDSIHMKMTEFYSIMLYNSMLDTKAPPLYIQLDGRKITLNKTHGALLFEACGVEAHHYDTQQITDDAMSALNHVEAHIQQFIDTVSDDQLDQINIISLNTIVVNAIKFIIDTEVPLAMAEEIKHFPDPFVPLDFVLNSLMDSMLQMMSVDHVCLALQSETKANREKVLKYVDYIIDEVKNTYQLLREQEADIVTTYQAVWHTYIDCFLKKKEKICKETEKKDTYITKSVNWKNIISSNSEGSITRDNN